MKPIFGLLMHSMDLLAVTSQTEKYIGTGAAIGAVAGGLIGVTAGSILLGAFLGAASIASMAFVMRPRVGWVILKDHDRTLHSQ